MHTRCELSNTGKLGSPIMLRSPTQPVAPANTLAIIDGLVVGVGQMLRFKSGPHHRLRPLDHKYDYFPCVSDYGKHFCHLSIYILRGHDGLRLLSGVDLLSGEERYFFGTVAYKLGID